MPEKTEYPISQETANDLSNRFVHHAPINDQPNRYAEIRAKLLEAASFITERTPKCREQSLAITKLEEAMYWSNASIARNEK